MKDGATIPSDENSDLPSNDGEDRIVAAIAHLAASAARDGKAPGQTSSSWQEACLREWAASLEVLLDAEEYASRALRGGQEHDVIFEEDRCIKITRDGVFGLAPGIELALVAKGAEARRFHLWEATPLQYLERLFLQNELTPGLNQLLGVLVQPGEISLVISQPRFDLNPATQAEIDAWFQGQGFARVTTAAYYREEDNLGIFDAHDKNVVKATFDPSILIPFDVIPVRPDGGFLDFIRDTLRAGDGLVVVRTTHSGSGS